MFPVRHANQVINRDVVLTPAEIDFGDFLRDPAHSGKMKHVVVTKHRRIGGCVRVNMALRRGVEDAYIGVRLGDVAHRNFILASDDDVVFDIVTQMARRKATMAIIISGVRHGARRPRAENVVGVLSREQLGDSVIESIGPFGG